MSDNHQSPGIDLAVVGATGAVGREMLEILAERGVPIASLRAIASERSAGEALSVDISWLAGDADRPSTVTVEDIEKVSFDGLDYALFTAGSNVSRRYAREAVDAGVTVIDNTSAFRMTDGVPLVVPEVNGRVLDGLEQPTLIANPNCSTTQMVVALEPLTQIAELERIVVSTYQSASGAGRGGVAELFESHRAWARHVNESVGNDGGGGCSSDMSSLEEAHETFEPPKSRVFDHPLAFEALPHIGSFDDSGFTSEERKMVHETRKIMGQPKLSVGAHCVRVPVVRSHSESLTVDFAEAVELDEVREAWRGAPGVRFCDEPERAEYPLARRAEGDDDTWIGRLRADLDRPNTIHFWVVSDNLRKGAALNSVQILERLMETARPR